ncbi:MAG: SH3 domain-containing protein, partial [Winogradskyella sp.]|uniref:SH3 domain-containing protein n=1 Tax=Winogradskyella sp. TaxID=1883156 RepID=UPI0017CB17CA|nr:SH3 domain-containing protein [Winogradskyella sp.]
KKRLSFIFSIIGLLIGCFALLMAFQKERIDKRDNPAIVFAQESRVKADPNKISEEVFRLHEGTKVQVLEIYKNWKKIKLSDNSTGWIPSNDIRLLSDF